tara:strand:+ start:14795 stop:15466 length:672 start_codon:yes stop_codon:yes gene_type:complete
VKISILTVNDHPFAGFIVRELEKKFKIFSIIFDSKKFSQKDKTLWDERTLGSIEYFDIESTNSIPKCYVSSHNSDELIKYVKTNKINLLINVGTPRILSKKLIESLSIGILNCHPGILPDYQGCSCVEWALYNEDPVGNTCHLMTEKIDSGPVIISEILDTKHLNNYSEIRTKLYLNSPVLLIKSLELIKEKNISSFLTLKGGKYYSPISKKKYLEVLKKINN